MSVERMDPEIARLGALVPALDDPDHLATRQRYKALFDAAPPLPVPDGVDITEEIIPGAPGDPDVRLRLYRPRSETPLPAMVYFHGGGFYVGDLEFAHPACLQLASEAGCLMVSVDYRLAPEHPFPAATEDGYAALRWTAERAGALGVDAARLAVGGSSAGGNLAAAMALMARDRGGPSLAFQLLIYPVLDNRLQTGSSREFTDTPILDRAATENIWRLYLGDDHAARDLSYAAPARCEDLRGLPRTYLVAAELDPLRDEGIDYALRLQRAGISTELHVVPDVPHGFVVARDAAITRRVEQEVVAVVREALGTGPR
jgi:acetyl esterase/lipase